MSSKSNIEDSSQGLDNGQLGQEDSDFEILKDGMDEPDEATYFEENINNEKPSKIKNIKIEDEETLEIDSDGWLDILGSGELKKKIIKKGLGVNSRPERRSWATINLVGRLENGIIVEEFENYDIILGDCEVVQGLDVSISLMEKEEIAEIVVPARLAYGSVGKPPIIPPDSKLHYKVEIVNTRDAEDEKTLPYQERVRLGNMKRERGNFWYARGDFSNAIHCYRRALDFLDEEEEVLQSDDAKHAELVDHRLKVYNNLTAAQLKIDALDAALKSVEVVLQLEPSNVKALYRKGKILGAKGETEEAIEFLRQALNLEPETKIIHQELAKLLRKKNKDVKAEKAMYRKMFAQSEIIPREVSTSKARLWVQRFGLLIGGLVVAALGVLVYKQTHSTR